MSNNTIPDVIFPIHIPAKISGCSLGVWRLGLQTEESLRKLTMQLFSKYSNLCDHDTLTSQTDGRTDRQTDTQMTCCDYTALCVASRGKNDKREDSSRG